MRRHRLSFCLIAGMMAAELKQGGRSVTLTFKRVSK